MSPFCDVTNWIRPLDPSDFKDYYNAVFHFPQSRDFIQCIGYMVPKNETELCNEFVICSSSASLVAEIGRNLVDEARNCKKRNCCLVFKQLYVTLKI